MNITFDQNASNAIAASRTEAIRLGHLFINTDDLLLGILSIKGDECAALLQKNGCDIGQLQHAIENDTVRQQTDAEAATVMGVAMQSNRNVMLTDITERVMKNAMQRAMNSATQRLTTRHIMQSMMEDSQNPAAERLHSQGLTIATFA